MLLSWSLIGNMLFLSTLESGKIIFRTVSVKDNRDIEINEINELKERKKGKKE
jgi:hypothetical protein